MVLHFVFSMAFSYRCFGLVTGNDPADPVLEMHACKVANLYVFSMVSSCYQLNLIDCPSPLLATKLMTLGAAFHDVLHVVRSHYFKNVYSVQFG